MYYMQARALRKSKQSGPTKDMSKMRERLNQTNKPGEENMKTSMTANEWEKEKQKTRDMVLRFKKIKKKQYYRAREAFVELFFNSIEVPTESFTKIMNEFDKAEEDLKEWWKDA